MSNDLFAFASIESEPTFAANDNVKEKNEWYTRPEYIERARSFMGAIDVDPASCFEAQRTVRANVFYTLADNGLNQQWLGRCWMNPPYSHPELGYFIDKLRWEYKEGRITEAVVLTENRTDTAWFRKLTTAATAVCFTHGRVHFDSPYNSKADAPKSGHCFSYIGPTDRVAQFKDAYAPIGIVFVHA